MYQKKNISNIRSYKVFGETIIYNKNTSERDFFINHKKYDISGFDEFYYLKSNIYIGNDNEEGLFRINNATKRIEKVKEYMADYIIDNYLIYENEENNQFEYYNNKFELEFNSQNHYTLIHKGFGVERERKGLDWTGNINGYSLPNTKLWHFSLSTIAPLPHDTETPDTVSEIIGVASQKLWVRTGARRLIVLDIETGELLKIFSHHESDKKQGYTYNEGFGSIHIKENDDDYLYCMGYDNFQKINTKTITIQEAYDTYKEDPVGIANFQDIYSPLLQGDYFTFIGRKLGESGGIRHVGIFDYTAKKLVWQYQVISEDEIAKGNELIAPEPLYISGNKLYVKDFHQTLHIFEKEE